RYRELVKSGRIAFTTFHQSMGYEEFVEGLRPVTDGDADEGTAGSGFRLVARNGLFRNICALAKESGTHNSNININLDKHAIFKMSLGNAKTEPYIYAASLKKNCITLGYGGQFDWSDPKFNKYDEVKTQWDTLGQDGQDMTSGIREFRKFRCDMSIGDIVIVSDGNSAFRAIGQVIGNYEYAEPAEDGEDPFDEGNYYHHRRKVKWLKVLEESLPVENIKSGKFTQSSCYRLDKSQINFDVLERLVSAGETVKFKITFSLLMK
ncbi:EVE domain-containing protein, partial [Hellea sp.]|nr:EVE domain-containing protein [Hellea sp.]